MTTSCGPAAPLSALQLSTKLWHVQPLSSFWDLYQGDRQAASAVYNLLKRHGLVDAIPKTSRVLSNLQCPAAAHRLQADTCEPSGVTLAKQANKQAAKAKQAAA
jgi:hypothetical protein